MASDLRSSDVYVDMVNGMLSQLHVNKHVKSFREINGAVFVILYEGFCGEDLPDIIRKPKSKEDEIHNCQSVINALSLDVLHTSLSHISGEEVANGDHMAIASLLEIFTSLMEYILNRIESDVSDNDNEGEEEEGDFDPDRVTPEIIDDILSRELGRGYTDDTQEPGQSKPLNPPAITIEQFHSPPIRGPKRSVDAMRKLADEVDMGASERREGQEKYRDYYLDGTGDSTAELIRESEEIERKLKEQEEALKAAQAIRDARDSRDDLDLTSSVSLPDNITPEKSDLKFGDVGVRPRPLEAMSTSDGSQDGQPPQQTFTHHFYHHFDSGAQRPKPYSSSLPYPSASDRDVLKNRYKSGPAFSKELQYDGLSRSIDLPTSSLAAVGRAIDRPTSVPVEPSLRPSTSREGSRSVSPCKTRSYDSLMSLTQETAALSRSAIEDSPVRHREDREAVLQAAIKSTLKKIQNEAKEMDQLSKTIPASTRRKEAGEKLSKSMGTDRTRKPSPKKLRGEGRRFKDLPQSTATATSRSRRQQTNEKEVLHDEENYPAYRKYLQKYKESRPDPSDDELSQHSDTAVDYDRNIRSKENVNPWEYDLNKDLAKSFRNSRKVHFGDWMNTTGPESLAAVRKRIDRDQRKDAFRTDLLNKIFEREYADLEDEEDTRLKKPKKKAAETESKFKQAVSKPKQRKPKKRSAPLSPTARGRGGGGRGFIRDRKRSASSSPPRLRRKTQLCIRDNDILPMLLEEFPYLYLSSETLHDLWRKSFRQIEQLSKAEQETKSRKGRAQTQLEEAEKRQDILTEIMRKELAHNQRMRDQRDRETQQRSIKTKLQEKRLQSTRIRKYYEEYQLRMRAKMLKKRTREELVFKRLFKEGLDIQRDRIRELRKYAKEQRSKRATVQQNEIESLENFYRDQFSLLAESMTKERDDLRTKETAQAKVLEQMKKELRKKMEREIGDLQQQLHRDEDDVYWRHLDAEKLKHELFAAKYKTTI